MTTDTPRICLKCFHPCHCNSTHCEELVGVGMTDKVQECGCDKCECKRRDHDYRSIAA